MLLPTSPVSGEEASRKKKWGSCYSSPARNAGKCFRFYKSYKEVHAVGAHWDPGPMVTMVAIVMSGLTLWCKPLQKTGAFPGRWVQKSNDEWLLGEGLLGGLENVPQVLQLSKISQSLLILVEITFALLHVYWDTKNFGEWNGILVISAFYYPRLPYLHAEELQVLCYLTDSLWPSGCESLVYMHKIRPGNRGRVISPLVGLKFWGFCSLNMLDLTNSMSVSVGMVHVPLSPSSNLTLPIHQSLWLMHITCVLSPHLWSFLIQVQWSFLIS